MELDTFIQTAWVHSSQTYMSQKGIHPRIQSKRLDRKLGFKIPKIEVKLQQKYRDYYRGNDLSNKKQHFEGTQTWIGLHPQVLQTPYSDIYECLTSLENKDVDNIIDIGAGYGRIGIVANSIFPNASFKGYEIVKKRSDEGNRIFEKWGITDCMVVNENVLEEDFVLPEAQIYFIYDFSEQEDISLILRQIESRTHSKEYFLITKGDRIDSLIDKKYSFKNFKFFKKYKDMTIYQSQSR